MSVFTRRRLLQGAAAAGAAGIGLSTAGKFAGWA
ncbi:MAG: twin-arginine translocation signal domain-containing protein, partial [Mesorhizobium sp.]